MDLKLIVNGEAGRVDDVPWWLNLLRLLRERLGLIGPKNGCEEGRCGSCSVLLDDRLVYACLVPAVAVDGREVRTVEDLATADGPSLLQRSFVETGAIQCGFCTPGLLLAAEDLLSRHAGVPEDDEIREAIGGNLCRCTGYTAVVEAIRLAATGGAGER